MEEEDALDVQIQKDENDLKMDQKEIDALIKSE